ncbi:MAG TPA: helix-turn-helix transcriptional regulator [Pyrinomonadaceae bacterium]|nr:helix-turn-helix transcriptional regulator [Pyrinomonadaceae bacterium]
MGIAASLKPARLAEKLVRIRTALGLSQNEMISRLGLSDELIREELSAFERGLRQPPLVVLLKYARSVGISTDVLIDDELNLPAKLLKETTREAVRRTRMPHTNRKR